MSNAAVRSTLAVMLGFCVLGLACSEEDGAVRQGLADAGAQDGSFGGQAGGAGHAGSAGAAGLAGNAGAGANAGAAGIGGVAGAAGVAGTAGAAGSGGSAGTPGAPAVRFIGRFDHTDPKGPQFEWSGSQMHARFSGTALNVHLSGSPNAFEAVVDGQASKVQFSGGDQVIPLAQGLGPGEHEIRLYRITEAFFWSTQFLGFDFGAGSLLAAPTAPDRRIEVVGDSISAGYGIEGADQSCPFSADTENHYLTYESIAARQLGADLITLAWSGIGMYSNFGGDTSSPRMPERYLLSMPDFPNTPWDFTSWIPHAVVINLGTNDFSNGDPGQPFVDAYAQFVTNMRARYPSALIYLGVSPMLGGSSYASLKTHLQSVMALRAAQGDTNLKLMEFTTDPNDGYGCDWHPSLATHQKMAAVMVSSLQADLGW